MASARPSTAPDGIGPHTLAIDGVGNLYGTTMFGGTHGYGTVYEYTPATGAYSVLYSFCAEANCSDGRWPFRVKLVIDAAGISTARPHRAAIPTM